MNGMQKRKRLPVLPKDDQCGPAISAEEREKQARELKRRLRKLVGRSDSNLPTSSTEVKKDHSVRGDNEWPTAQSSPSRLGNQVVKKKRQKVGRRGDRKFFVALILLWTSR